MRLFEVAKKESPENSVDVVIACAGISGVDPVFYNQGIVSWAEQRDHR